MKEVLMRSKLTKTLYMSVSPGLYITSNTMEDRNTPVFAAYVPESIVARELQWKAIVAAKCNGRHCNVFQNEAIARNYLTDLNLQIEEHDQHKKSRKKQASINLNSSINFNEQFMTGLTQVCGRCQRNPMMT